MACLAVSSIEGIPFIIRFKTYFVNTLFDYNNFSIEGIPFIIRFKTPTNSITTVNITAVLKVFHL